MSLETKIKTAIQGFIAGGNHEYRDKGITYSFVRKQREVFVYALLLPPESLHQEALYRIPDLVEKYKNERWFSPPKYTTPHLGWPFNAEWLNKLTH